VLQGISGVNAPAALGAEADELLRRLAALHGVRVTVSDEHGGRLRSASAVVAGSPRNVE
jgi:hypothetical protein